MSSLFAIQWPDVHKEMSLMQLTFARARLISNLKSHIRTSSLFKIRDTFIVADKVCNRLMNLARYCEDVASPTHRKTVFGGYVSSGPTSRVLKVQSIERIEDLVEEVTCWMLQRGDCAGHTYKDLRQIQPIARRLNRLIKEMLGMENDQMSLLRALDAFDRRRADSILSGFEQRNAEREVDDEGENPWRHRLPSVKEYCDRNGYFVRPEFATGINENTATESSFTQMKLNRDGTHSVQVHAAGTYTVKTEAWTNPNQSTSIFATLGQSAAFREALKVYHWPINSRGLGARGTGSIGSQSRSRRDQLSLPFSQIPGLVGDSSLAVGGQWDDGVSLCGSDGDSVDVTSAIGMAAEMVEEAAAPGTSTDPSSDVTKRSKHELEGDALDAPQQCAKKRKTDN